MLAVVVGMVGGWTSPYLAKLTSPDGVLTVTEDEASWIASVVGLGRIGGAVTATVMVDCFGTRSAVLWTGVPHALGWISLIAANNVWWIYFARVLGGFGLGMYFGTFPLYMGEVSSPKIRGALIALIAQGMPFGILLGNLIGAYTSMWLFSCISLVPNIAFLLLFMAMPHSPYYLIRRGLIDDARRSLEWYNRGVDVTAELHSLQEFISSKQSITYCDKLGQLLGRDNRKGVLIISVMLIFVQLSGLWTLSFYMEIVLKNAGVTVVEPSLVVIIVGASGIVFGWASMWMNDKFGRKVMLTTSCIGTAFSYLLLGIDYHLLDAGSRSEVVTQWLPIIGVIVFQCSICIGITPVPSILMSELLSPDAKTVATCISNLCSAVFAFITSKTYQPMVDLTSEQYVFWLYGSLMLGLAVFTVLCIPETKGKSLQEIQQMMTGKKLVTADPKCDKVAA